MGKTFTKSCVRATRSSKTVSFDFDLAGFLREQEEAADELDDMLDYSQLDEAFERVIQPTVNAIEKELGGMEEDLYLQLSNPKK